MVPSPSDATLFASGSDDGNVCIWSREEKKPREVLKVGYPVTALEWTKDGSGLFVGGIDNQIHVSSSNHSLLREANLADSSSAPSFAPLQLYDLHQKAILYSLSLHTDTITTLRLSPSGSYLFSFGFDSSLKVWDVRPFAISSNDLNPSDSASSTSEQRIYKTLSGAIAPMDNALIKGNWSKDGKRIILGSGDRSCVVWDVESSKMVYKLPGHRGTCTAGDYHPKEPIGEYRSLLHEGSSVDVLTLPCLLFPQSFQVRSMVSYYSERLNRRETSQFVQMDIQTMASL